MKRIVLLLVVLSMFWSISSLADVDTGYPCSLGCESLNDNGDTYYCNFDTGTCFQAAAEEPTVNQTANVTASAAAPSTSLTTEEKVALLEENLALLQQSLDHLTTQDIETIKSQLNKLQADLEFLKSNLQQELHSQGNSIATGLAGLQEGVDKTQQTLTAVQEALDKKQQLNRFLTTALLILLVGGVTGGAVFYVNRKKKNVSPEIVDYITKHIQQGTKFPQIKQKLVQAGWSEQDIEWAYKETVKQNYQQYKTTGGEGAAKKTSMPRKAAPRLAYDPKKMISVAVVSILLIVGILFLLRGLSTGQAIFFQKGVKDTGEVTYAVECTPPHILTPTKDACCLDVDNSTVCDNTEARQGQVTGGACTDNNQCPAGEYCVNGNCGTLASLYTGQGDCTKLCSYYAVKMLTSDGETYSVKPKRGSYTAAGALEWKLLEMPQHCKGEVPIVPVNIILKRPGEIISEEVITLHQGENSGVLTHADLPQIAFTLTADTVYETCPK